MSEACLRRALLRCQRCWPSLQMMRMVRMVMVYMVMVLMMIVLMMVLMMMAMIGTCLREALLRWPSLQMMRRI